MALDVEALFLLAEKSPVLDTAEQALREAGHGGTADRLNKLQQDAAVDLERGTWGGEYLDPPSGPDTAAIVSRHEAVTPARLSVLAESAALLGAGPVKDSLLDIARQLPAAAAPAVVSPAPKTTP